MRRKLLLVFALGAVATFAAAFGVGCSTPNSADDTPEHNYGEWVIDRKASCEEVGRKYHTCADEGCNNMEWEVIPKTPHKYDIPNRTNAGHSFTCSVCKTTTEIEPHNFKNGICVACGADENEDYNFTFELSSDESYYTLKSATDKTATEIIIPSTYKGKPIKEVSNEAFRNFTDLKCITIPDNCSVSGSVFDGCDKLTEIKVSENNEYYKTIDGNLYSKDGTTLVRYIGKQTEFEIPQTVTTIGSYAFSNYTTLKNVVLRANLLKVEAFAFYGCTSLESVTFDNTAGWRVGEYNINVIEGKEVFLTTEELSDTAQAAFYLTDKYNNYSWTNAKIFENNN